MNVTGENNSDILYIRRLFRFVFFVSFFFFFWGGGGGGISKLKILMDILFWRGVVKGMVSSLNWIILILGVISTFLRSSTESIWWGRVC